MKTHKKDIKDLQIKQIIEKNQDIIEAMKKINESLNKGSALTLPLDEKTQEKRTDKKDTDS